MNRRARPDADDGGRSAAAPDVLLVGLSTRALADTALRSGLRVRSVDFFGDLDQRERVENVCLRRDLGLPWSALHAARVAASLEAPAAAYAADLENWPDAVALLSRGRELLGNVPETLAAARDPQLLFGALRRAGVPTPITVWPGHEGREAMRASVGSQQGTAGPTVRVGASAGLRWLVKPRRGGGGRGISAAAPGRDPGPDEILQEIVEGPVMSLAFVADGAEVRPLAISAEIAERAAFGGPGLAYVGSMSRPPEDVDETSVREQALCAAGAVTRAFGLRGWNGMDFVLRRGEVVPLEINPRHTSSMDLWDEPGARLFAAHAEACRGRLCGTWLSPPPETRGKAILYARRAVRVGESRSWLGAAGDEGSPRWPERAVADVPHPGERIEGGQPVCSLYAAAPSPAECLAALRDLAARAERDLAPAEAPAPGGRTAASGAVATAASAEPRRPHRAATSPPEERR